MRRYFSILLFLPGLLIVHSSLFAQEEKEFVMQSFKSTLLVNMQTTQVQPVKSFDFSIRHRFGMTGPDSTMVENFFGLDLPANIRLGISVPVSKSLYVGIGRTKVNKDVDGEVKLLFMRQTEDNKNPVSAAVYFNTTISSGKMKRVPDFAFFNDSITPFENKFGHRVSYNSQLIISRKISETFSLQAAPVLIYKNLVSPGEENHTFAVPVGLTIKTGMKSSVILEYAYRFNNRPLKNNYPVSLGWEIGTVGHVFQLFVSSSADIPEQEVYTQPSFDYAKGFLAMGFNIRRTFWLKNKNKA